MRVRSRFILGVLLCVSLLCSSFTVLAVDYTIFDTIPRVEDVSKFVGITEDRLTDDSCNAIRFCSDYSFAFIYEKDDKLYQLDVEEVVGDDGNITTEIVFVEVTSIDALEYTTIGNHFYYTEMLISDFYDGLHLVAKDSSNNIFYVGKFTGKQDFQVIDISFDSTPVVSLSLSDKTENSAKINVSYELDEKFVLQSKVYAYVEAVELYSEDNLLQVIDTRDTDDLSFTVNSNGEYKVVVHTPVSSGESTITVDNIDTGLDEPEVTDKKAPIVTFSTLPEGLVEGTDTSLTIYTDEPSIIGFNGAVSKDYVTEFTVIINCNGDYNYFAEDAVGNRVTDSLVIECFGATDNENEDDNNNDDFWEEEAEDELPQTGENVKGFILIGALILIISGVSIIVYANKDKLLSRK